MVVKRFYINKPCKGEEHSSFVSSPNLKLTAPTVLFGIIADVTVGVANIQQFKLFLFQTQYKVPLAAQKLLKEGGREQCVGGSFEINQAQLMLQLLNKRQSWGTLSLNQGKQNSFVFDQINTAWEHSGYAATGVSSWG